MNTRIQVRFVLLTIVGLMAAVAAVAQTGPYQFYAVAPCRVVDTRNAVSTNGGPALGTVTRDFQIRGGTCGVPLTAKAVSLNVTILNASAYSWLTLWPSGSGAPNVSTINYDQNSPALANGAIVGLSSNTNDLSVNNAFGGVNVILDVTGYFQ
jgi:hypothetical protein